MPDSHKTHRLSYLFLCSGPFLAIALGSIRPLRMPGVHQAIGGFVFAIFATATWRFASHGIKSPLPESRLGAMAGVLLVLPFSLIALFWVGLGPPWLASPADNQMRYLLLVVMAAAVVAGSIALKEALSISGERFYSTLGLAGIVLAGPLYLFGEAILLASYSASVRSGQAPPEVFHTLSELQDILLFFASSFTYAAAATFAISMCQAGWLGRKASRTYVIISFAALVSLVVRGLQFPDPAALSTPWFMTPGLIVGVPAVPFIVPYLLGVVSIRHTHRS